MNENELVEPIPPPGTIDRAVPEPESFARRRLDEEGDPKPALRISDWISAARRGILLYRTHLEESRALLGDEFDAVGDAEARVSEGGWEGEGVWTTVAVLGIGEGGGPREGAEGLVAMYDRSSDGEEVVDFWRLLWERR